MGDILDRAYDMINTLAFTQSKNIGQAYPDKTIANMLSELVGEIREWRSAAAVIGVTEPTELRFTPAYPW